MLEKAHIRFKLTSLVENEAFSELIYEIGFTGKKRTTVLAVKTIPGVSSISLVDCQQS